MNRLPAIFSCKRCMMHVPVGVLAGWLLTVNKLHDLGWAVFIAFFIYEISEDWRIRDHAYIDIIGFLAGLSIIGIWRLL